MVSTGRAARQYLQTQVRSRTPLELVVMLYDAALRSVTAAADAARRRDIAARRDAISHAMAILAELQSCLDMERGGTIAAELDRLYAWMRDRLLEATVRQKVEPILEVARVLDTLRDGWRQIASNPAGAATP
jgi:flagellar secretion chaperone FliS